MEKCLPPAAPARRRERDEKREDCAGKKSIRDWPLPVWYIGRSQSHYAERNSGVWFHFVEESHGDSGKTNSFTGDWFQFLTSFFPIRNGGCWRGGCASADQWDTRSWKKETNWCKDALRILNEAASLFHLCRVFRVTAQKPLPAIFWLNYDFQRLLLTRRYAGIVSEKINLDRVRIDVYVVEILWVQITINYFLEIS